ncbi:serine protease [Yoonia sp. F2084L]|uniref:serine protease n=1 Tax=Yoonia sp. F2084L TaxID=2926419 RepID=UPI001FF38611|nr:serine protease [Yoonia sp. F2084L]MCK0094021.1 serine protease [Yoonia sp. F2084L]
MFKAFFAGLFFCLSAVAAQAQDQFWVQIEARQTLSEATERARNYARSFDDVQGYYLGRGFYGIVLGPYSENLARAELSRLLSTRQIPSDSYLQNGRQFEQQFWPIGGGVAAPRGPSAEEAFAQEISALPQIPLTAPQETLREARTSERALSREAREELQKALRWAGFYNAAIDGSFGRGTRSAMESWQAANAQDPTGVLTARQRELLLQQYNAVLIDVGMELARDQAAGIQMQIPAAVVAFSEYQPPFAKFAGQNGLPQAQVLLISQRGDTGRLIGLYEVLQILDVIPPEGRRSLRGDSFEIEGIGDGLHTYATASLQDGEIKGFILVWPEGDDRRRARVLDVMQSSFTRLDGTLDPNLVPPGEDQAIDMVAGLAVRQPQLSRSGFYVANDGALITTTEAVESCERITFDRNTRAEVISTDLDLGVALLRPLDPLTPIDVASFQSAIPRLQDRVAVAGYPFNGVLNAPTLTFGALEDIRSLDGDDRIKRLSVDTKPSNAGGPVLDETGQVLGMLLPRIDSAQTLPADVQFSLDAAQIVAFLEAQGMAPNQGVAAQALTSVALSRKAANVTVLVSCW